jgi:ABC-2 type transport system permease protein
MNDVLTLLKPRFISIKNGSRAGSRGHHRLKLAVLGTIGLAFWTGLFAVSLRVLYYFKGIEQIGDILAFKLLSMILITSFALLLFSSILTALAKLYLSRDLLLVHAMPIATHKIFSARWIDSTLDSAWMVIVYTIPVFLAYGIAFKSGPFFYLSTLLALPALSVIASALSALLVMVAVILIPANRMKNVFILLGILFFVVMYLAIRLLKPETLVDPEVFDTVLIYITSLQTPAAPWLPSTWAFDAIKAGLDGNMSTGLFHLALAWSFAAVMIYTIILVADRYYYTGFSKTQTAQARLIRKKAFNNRLPRFLPGSIQAFTEKEIKSFFRDQSQWSQLFLIAALIVIYIYNFKVLPLEKSPIETVYLQNLLSFLNMGLALFVLTAIAGRFAFPAVSAEKDAFWIVRISPISIKSFLWIKFFTYYPPLLLLSEILIVATNILLNVAPVMMFISTVTVFCIVPGIVALGVGLGAAYPDFKAENPTQTVTSFGGLLFMILCASFIGMVLVLEAGPVYHLLMAEIKGRGLSMLDRLWVLGSFLAAFAISVGAVFLPMHFGSRRLAAT